MAGSRGTLWMLGARADTHDAERRAEIVAAIGGSAARANWLLLETCHRVELYGFGPAPDLGPSLQLLTGDGAVIHVMRVAAGLDSAIVGEDEVLHQVRHSLAAAAANANLDRRLHRLFETAIAAGRQARRSRHASSANLAQKAMEWLNEKSRLSGRAVLVVGAGHMGSALAHKAALLDARVTIASRNPLRARRLASVYGADSVDLVEAAALTPEAAAVAVALGGPWHELQPSARAVPPIADISAPPAVGAAIRQKANGDYLGIDDLFFSQESVPRGYTDNAKRIVESKSEEFVAWLNART
jgi:glutamyl-tRNA reductase